MQRNSYSTETKRKISRCFTVHNRSSTGDTCGVCLSSDHDIFQEDIVRLSASRIAAGVRAGGAGEADRIDALTSSAEGESRGCRGGQEPGVSACADDPGTAGRGTRGCFRRASKSISPPPALLNRLFGRIDLRLRRVQAGCPAFGDSPLAMVINYIQNSIENIEDSRVTCLPAGTSASW